MAVRAKGKGSLALRNWVTAALSLSPGETRKDSRGLNGTTGRGGALSFPGGGRAEGARRARRWEPSDGLCICPIPHTHTYIEAIRCADIHTYPYTYTSNHINLLTVRVTYLNKRLHTQSESKKCRLTLLYFSYFVCVQYTYPRLSVYLPVCLSFCLLI